MTIYSVEEAEGVHFLTMELGLVVDGHRESCPDETTREFLHKSEAHILACGVKLGTPNQAVAADCVPLCYSCLRALCAARSR